MISDELKNELKNILSGDLLFDEPMSAHTTIRAGGAAAVLATPKNREELTLVLKLAKDNEVEVFVLGSGSNVMVRDSGFNGIVISTAAFRKMEIVKKDDSGIRVVAEAALPVADLVNLSAEECVKGFEGLSGIPGSVGGALNMNAGTYKGVISDTLVEVEAFDKSGTLYTWPKKKIEFGYRKARFPKSCVILSGTFDLEKGSKEEICGAIEELKEKRKTRHPQGFPSMGSIFKNPEKGASAGVLIEDAGLKGVRVGGARVANEHAGWIINEDNATAKDIEILIQLVREKVKENAEIALETEVVIIGDRA